MEKLVLGYYYRRKRVQEKYEKLYGVKSRAKKKTLRKLKERKKKQDVKWKIANIAVRTTYEMRYTIVLKKLGKRPADNMIMKFKDEQLRHRMYRTSFKGIQKAIEGEAKEYGVPVVYVDPKNTSKQCPIHRALIIYDTGSRIGRCSKEGELWYRDVATCWNLLFKALGGDGGNAPNLLGLSVDGSHVPLGSTTTHDPAGIPEAQWAR